MLTLEELIQAKKNSIILFHADWFQPSVETKQMVLDVLNKSNFNLKLICIDTDIDQEVTNKFKIDVIPTILIFRSGEVIWKHRRGPKRSDFEQVVSSLIRP